MRVRDARRFLHVVLVVALALVAASPSRCDSASMSSFSYQGRLDEAGLPATGTYRLTFKLFDAEADGNQVGPTVAQDSVPVLSGLFAVQLDFGVNAFGAGPRWLQMSANDEVLAPRRPIVPVPVAQFSLGPWATAGQDISYTVGKVGIGTSIPTAALELANGDLKLSAPGAGVVFPDGSRLGSAICATPDHYILTASSAPPAGYSFAGQTVSTDSTCTARTAPPFWLAGVGGLAALGDDLYVVGKLAAGKYSLISDSWTQISPRPVAREDYAVVAAVGGVYVIGGSNPGSCLGTVEVYDPASGVWSNRSPLSVPRKYLAAVELDGRIYAIGGQTGSNTASAVVERYDPAANAWTTLPPLPTPRLNVGAAACGGRVYVVGGRLEAGGNYSRAVEVFDPAANAWSVGPGFPAVVDAPKCVTVSDTVFAVGGAGNDAIEQLVPSTGKWRLRDALPYSLLNYGQPLAVAVAETVFYVDPPQTIIEYVPSKTLYVHERNQ